MLAARRSFDSALEPAQRSAFEEALADALGDSLASAQIIGGYAPFGGEISPAVALARAEQEATIAYPAFDMRDSCFQYFAGALTEKGPWGMLQPPLDGPEVTPDLILVPLVAIDGRGTRIGRGKGHYDRVLATLAPLGATMIGVGWANQRLDIIIPPDEWDIPLHGFASPKGLEMFAP